MTRTITTIAACGLALLLSLTPAAPGADAATTQPVSFTATDTAGAAVQIPAPDRPTLVLFIMADQPQSKAAIAQVTQVLAGAGNVQAIAVMSGQDAAAHARDVQAQGAWSNPVVADPDYAASGKLAVHAWPTTLVIDVKGQPIAHLGGLSPAFAKELSDYLAFAAGKIDRPTLDKRLAEHQVLTDTPRQKAARHLQIAQRLMEQGFADQARQELESGLRLDPRDGGLRLAQARLFISMGQPRQALDHLAQIEADAAPAWQVNALRGRALIALGQWQQAELALAEAVKLNPQPAEAHYLAGLAQQAQSRHREAADSFRRAFEATAAGKQAALAPPPATR